MFGFVILHGDFEHIIAAYAHAMNLGLLAAGLGLVRMAGGLRWMRLIHERILTRPAKSARIQYR
jgi:hypothetical protein